MDITEQSKFYDQHWAGLKKLNSLKLRRATRILELFTIVKRKVKVPRLIDLGCGDGRFAAFLGEFAEVDAIDLSNNAMEAAYARAPHVNYFSGSALDYPLKNNYYDAVISQEVLEHIEDQQAYIDVCHRILKPGGYLILTTPNKFVFDHMEGGNWSRQPVEKLLAPNELRNLVRSRFYLQAYDSMIMNFGNKGHFKLLNSRITIGISKRLGVQIWREKLMGKCGYGLHQIILGIKAK